MSKTSEYYENQIAVVTGGASGIGLALVEMMLSFGAKGVVLADVNDENIQRETTRLEATYPGKVLGIHCDVTQESEVVNLIEKTAEFGDGRVDLLFNNAGAGFGGRFDELTNEDWEKAFALNFYATVYGIRAVLPIMRAQGSGHIVSVISGIALYPMPQQSMYSATKSAMNALTLSMRYELWDENIRVTSATPGTTVTPIWEDKGAPADAWTAEEAAASILEGVANNERLILGESDRGGAKTCFDPAANAGIDQYLIDIARRRRAGEWAV